MLEKVGSEVQNVVIHDSNMSLKGQTAPQSVLSPSAKKQNRDAILVLSPKNM